MAQHRPNRGSTRGDQTGRLREQLTQQAAQELAEREGEITTITHAQQTREEKGIFDPKTQEMVDADPDYEEPESIEYVSLPDEVEDLTAQERPVDAQPHLLAQEPVVEIEDLGPPVVVDERKVVIRVNETLEQVTIGYGHTYDFVEGRRYKVPLHVAMHLEEKGLVWH